MTINSQIFLFVSMAALLALPIAAVLKKTKKKCLSADEFIHAESKRHKVFLKYFSWLLLVSVIHFFSISGASIDRGTRSVLIGLILTLLLIMGKK